MKIVLRVMALIVTASLAAALAQAPRQEELQVVYNLSGAVQRLENKELVVTFSDDMLPLGGKRDGAALLGISPAVAGEFSWRGSRSLAFKPAARFRYSTTYTAVIPAGTRSLAGRTLAREVRWHWVTPLAYPVEIRSAARPYFSSLAPDEKLDFPVWVKDCLFLRFGQPVSAAAARDFCILKEAKSGARVAIRLSQKAADTIEIRYEKDLERGLLYQFILKKGFCGSEGSTGTDKEFSFTFETVPSFRYAGKDALVLFPDAPYCFLPFSNFLAQFDARLIHVVRTSGRERSPLKFHVEPRYYGNDALFLRIEDELASGDSLSIQVGRDLMNVYKEQLPKGLDIEATVCSSRSPRIGFSLQDKTFSVTAKSMRRARVRLLKLKPGFYTRLADQLPGLLQRKGFRDEFVEKELLQDFTGLPEKENRQALRDGELGSPLGFFGFLVQRCEPYNTCRDIGLSRQPMFMAQQLEVFHRRDMDMVIKAAAGQTLFWLYDNRTGEGLSGKPILVWNWRGEGPPLGETNASGILTSEYGVQAADLVLARDEGRGDMAMARIDYPPDAAREVRINVFSDRDFYKPGDTVHIAGVVKEYAAGKISSIKAGTVSLEITGPDWQQVKREALALDPLGGFHYEFNSDPAGKKGRYHILVRHQGFAQWQGRHEVTIDYYQPNTFQVSLAAVAERYRFQDSFRPMVSGSYLAGNPMAGDDLAYGLALHPAGAGIFTADSLMRFSFGLDPLISRSDQPFSGAEKLDGEGRRGLDIPMSRFGRTNYLAGIEFSATAKSAEGKEFTARARSVFFPGDQVTGIRIGYYQSLKDPVRAELALVDFQGKPVAGEVRLSLYQEYYENYRRKLKKVSGPDDLFIDKVKSYEFRPGVPGRYVLCCETPDAKGRVIATSAQFFAWDSGYSDRDESLRIESEQSEFPTGGTLKCFIRSPRPGRALVTIERGRVLDSMAIELQKMTPLEIPVKKDYFPAIRLGVVAMYTNNSCEEAFRDFQVLDPGKSLNVALECPAEIKPASRAKVKIRVSDARQKGARARLFVYAVDEGNLSLQGYRTPDLLGLFYYSNPLGRDAIRTYYSKNFTHWTFGRPMMDIDLAGPAIFGCVFRPDATPIAGATVTLEDEKHNKLRTATTSAQGYYQFPGIPSGHYSVKAEAKDFQPFICSDIYFSGSGHSPCDLALLPVGEQKYWEPEPELGAAGEMLGGAVEAIAPAPMAERKMMASEAKGETGRAGKDGQEIDVSGIRVRSDFKEVLFFRTIETDADGGADFDFQSSDQLSTYRIMAVAYGEEGFGKAEKPLVVSKELLISEAMPEFARQEDEFQAGVQVSNRSEGELSFTLLAKPLGITIDGSVQGKYDLAPRSNGLFRFPFRADRIGDARVNFFAVSAADKDGLEKVLPVTDRLIDETLLDFASGRNVRKVIEPQAGGQEQVLTIRATPSLLRPAVNIAKKLVFYPYECLEQRTSKVMPFLALSPALAERLELGLDQEQIREAIRGYLKIIPEFMSPGGALSYYRGGQYTSDYLTTYVLWALHLARERDYNVDPQLVQKLAGYLKNTNLDKTTECFHQFVLSLHKEADGKKLKRLASDREALPMPARVFLYRALHNQGIESGLLKAMLAEFNNGLQVEADFAYFDAGEFAYDRDYPFYSSRFATALLLQAILEVEHGHVLAERLINWLLEGEPYCWNTTQTNFWILSAMDEYLKQVEKKTASRAEIALQGEKAAKTFTDSRDSLQVSRMLADTAKPVEALISADQPVYVTSELTWKIARAGEKSRGIDVQRNIYDEKGEKTEIFRRGQVYQVELLVRADKELPYGVIDEPLAAGFELLRQDVASTRSLAEFNSRNRPGYYTPWLRQENSADRLLFYTYMMQGKMRVVYFIKAMYSGRFTWLPTVVQGMYHPQYFGRTGIRTIEVRE